MVPQTFNDWKNCISIDCGIALTKEFAQRRLFIYSDLENLETKKFVSLYGQLHLNNITQWLKQI